MRFLDQYDVLAIAARVLRCSSDDAVRRTNLDAVDEVLSDVRRTGGLAEAAGVLLAGLVRARAFEGANRVVTVAVVLQFCSLNRSELRLEPVEEVDELLDRIAADGVSADEVADFLRERLKPEHVTAEDLQEHLRIDLLLEDEVKDLASAVEDELSRRGGGMFELFTDSARRAVVLAQEEARMLSHTFIGTEHLLLGIIHEGQGGGGKVLADLGVTAPAVRDLVVEIIGRGTGRGTAGTIPFTPRAKSTLEHAYQEAAKPGRKQARARRLGSEILGTEHLLLGLLRDGEGVATQILLKLGHELDDVRRKTHDWIDHRQRLESAVSGYLTDEAETAWTTPEAEAAWTTYGRRHHLLAELNAVLDENERLHEQVAALRALLRRHNIDPED
ncbi:MULTISPECIES: Clp protease N-terminal domain-containing protein [unclassified Kribbella]|uniref:Clp protease N-terminal domain-containing protein n=1 Tax=unclassified Kribbella TaxID=2644121 RepID=UPI0033EB016E